MKFYEKVKFFHDEKSRKLSDMIKSYRNFFLNEIEMEIKKILRRHENVYISQLSKKLGKTVSDISNQITKLEKIGRLRSRRIGNKKIVYI